MNIPIRTVEIHTIQQKKSSAKDLKESYNFTEDAALQKELKPKKWVHRIRVQLCGEFMITLDLMHVDFSN